MINIDHKKTTDIIIYQGDKYQVTFTLMDQSGNFSIHNSRPLIFSQPSVSTQSE